jgi:hypothetical protein
MKVIIYIIFMFFSAQSYSGEIDGKNIICNWDYDEYIKLEKEIKSNEISNPFPFNCFC